MGENIVSLILLLGFEVTMTKVGCYFLARVDVSRVLMVIKGFLIIGALGSTLVFSSCSSGPDLGRGRGQGHGKRGAGRFQEQDRDRDGRLNYQEFQQSPLASRASSSQAAFSQLDANRDGYLTKSELAAGRPQRRNR